MSDTCSVMKTIVKEVKNECKTAGGKLSIEFS